MRRREFITGLGAAAWPLAALAQQPDQMRRIGVLMPGDENDPRVKSILTAFTQALTEWSWTDGRNVRMDIRWGRGDFNRMRGLAQELVGLQPDVILTRTTAATVAVQRETRTIPIVFVNVADPVATGLVPRLNQPGGNITGFANFEASLGGKWLELLSEIAPGLKRVAIMFNPDINPVSFYFMPYFETAARSMKVEAITAPVHDDVEIETAIIALGREPGGGLVVTSDVFVTARRAPIILAAARNKVPRLEHEQGDWKIAASATRRHSGARLRRHFGGRQTRLQGRAVRCGHRCPARCHAAGACWFGQARPGRPPRAVLGQDGRSSRVPKRRASPVNDKFDCGRHRGRQGGGD